MHKVNATPCAKQKSCDKSKKPNSKLKWLNLSVTLLIVFLMLTGCASNSTNSRAVVVQPFSSAIVESADASSFYQKLTVDVNLSFR